MAMITIDGVDLPSPSSFKIPRSDLDSSDTGRNELGVLQRDRIRQGIYKIELEWKAINSSDLYLIESAIEPAELNVTFPTPTDWLLRRCMQETEILKWLNTIKTLIRFVGILVLT